MTGDEKRARDEATTQRLAAIEASSPWMNLAESSAYEKRGKRWLTREAHAGRVRCCRIGGRAELMFRREWLDQHMEDMSTPMLVRRRTG